MKLNIDPAVFKQEPLTILLGEYGSVAQGTANENSDHDYMGVVLEPEEYVIGLEKYETKRVSDVPTGQKSLPGGTDTTYHSLRKFVSLCAQGNPTVGSVLHLPKYELLTEIGESLIASRDLFWSARAGHAYLGYLQSQIKSLLDPSRQRAELVEQFGYDTKFGYHAYRLGIQGVTYMRDKTPMLPLTGRNLSFAKEIRAGQVELESLLSVLDSVAGQLTEYLQDSTTIPDQPDYEAINVWLIEAHQAYWQWGVS